MSAVRTFQTFVNWTAAITLQRVFVDELSSIKPVGVLRSSGSERGSGLFRLPVQPSSVSEIRSLASTEWTLASFVSVR